MKTLKEEILDLLSETSLKNPDIFTDEIIAKIEKRIDSITLDDLPRTDLITNPAEFMIYKRGFDDTVDKIKEGIDKK